MQVCLHYSGDSVLFKGSRVKLSCEVSETTSTAVVLQVTKNKCASPARMGEFDLMFGTGISSEGCTLDAAEVVGAVQRKGSWYHPPHPLRRMTRQRVGSLAGNRNRGEHACVHGMTACNSSWWVGFCGFVENTCRPYMVC